MSLTKSNATRLDLIREVIVGLGLDGILISDPDNRFYVTGYLVDDHGPTESAGVALVGRDQSTLFTSPNNTEWAAEEAAGFEVVSWTRPWEKRLAEHIATLGWSAVGFEPASLSYNSWRHLSEHANGFAFHPMNGEIDRLRWVKSPCELELIQRAIDITDRAFETVEAAFEPGKSERQIAAEIEQLYRELGADGPAFPTAVGSGANGARPHHNTGDQVIESGEPIVIDMGARLGGYCADLTRTTWIGEISDEVAHVYGVVADAQLAALNATGAGVPAKVVDQATRDVFERAGLSEYVIHSVGHGLGIRIHDGPSVSIESELPLEVGNVVTIEPGLYLPGSFGVRIEDVVAVEENGCRVLSHARKATVSG